MGILPVRGKATVENIPSKNNKSMFSQERYQFMLDAPFEISHMCCSVMKKAPMKRYAKETGRVPITAQMASESRLRTQVWLKQGCNAFDAKKPISNPMSFWTEQDVLLYLYTNNISIAPVYGEIIKENEVDGQLDLADLGLFDCGNPVLKTTGMYRTGCFACGFGITHEKCQSDSRIQNIIDFSNPKFADWMLRGGAFDERGLWTPKGGLGMWFIYEWVNMHGDFEIWYPDREHYLKTYMTKETRKYLEG